MSGTDRRSDARLLRHLAEEILPKPDPAHAKLQEIADKIEHSSYDGDVIDAGHEVKKALTESMLEAALEKIRRETTLKPDRLALHPDDFKAFSEESFQNGGGAPPPVLFSGAEFIPCTLYAGHEIRPGQYVAKDIGDESQVWLGEFWQCEPPAASNADNPQTVSIDPESLDPLVKAIERGFAMLCVRGSGDTIVQSWLDEQVCNSIKALRTPAPPESD